MTLPEILILAALAFLAVLNIIQLMRSRSTDSSAQLQALLNQMQQAQQQQQQGQERTERSLREQVQSTSQATRQELGGNFVQFQQALAAQMTSVATLQNNQIDAFSQQLVKLNESNAAQLEQMRQALIQQGQSARDEQAVSLKRLGDTLSLALATLDRIERAAHGRDPRYAGTKNRALAGRQCRQTGRNAQDRR